MKVLFIAAEAEPFAKGGGLGDAVSGLAGALARLKVKVTVALPLYSEVRRRGHQPRDTGRSVALLHGGGERTARFFLSSQEGVDYLFVELEGYFARDGIYGPPGGEYPDSAERFAFLTRAALAGARELGIAPDLVHAHDWHAALAPWYLPPRGGSARRPPVLLTIHNLAYQGWCGQELIGPLGLPPDGFTPQGYEFHGQVNFLKGGIIAADGVNAVSPTYAREILTPERGEGLDGVLRGRAGALSGILNGVDPGAWNPATDPSLPANYSPRAMGGKARCKRALQEEVGLARDQDSPLFSFVGRLTGQKGIDLLLEGLPALLALGGQAVLLGAGEPRYQQAVLAAAAAHPGQAAARVVFDPGLARRIYAGSDFLLMPSLFEPCGLGQMYAMRYGALPVARRTGGLADTVRDLSLDPDGGNGFLFEEFTRESFEGAIARAMLFGRAGKAFRLALERVMRLDHSWGAAAKGYLALYRSLLSVG